MLTPTTSIFTAAVELECLRYTFQRTHGGAVATAIPYEGQRKAQEEQEI